jgi:predicted Zn-dependent peptidase
VGQFDVAQVKKLLEETFVKVPASGLKRTPIPEEPNQTAERRFVLHAPGKERMTIAYHKPTLPDQEDYLFDLLNEIIANGRSTRLYRSLILNKRIAAGVSSYTGAPGSKLPNLFLISVTPLQGHTSEECLKAIDEEIARIQQEGVTEQELTGAKNRILADMIWKMESNDGMAEHISYFEGIGSSWQYLRDYEGVVQRLTTDDINRLAQKYLVSGNRTIGILKP